MDCQAGGVEQVVCEVYDADGNWLVTGGPWPCEAGSGRVEGILPGQGRIFVALAEDEFGNVRYQGETTGISIEAGQITQGVAIDAYLFIPTLSAPENEAQDVDPSTVSLEWETVENADEYLVQVATDTNFETIIINETTPATAYAPSTLEPLTEYFWKICAVDMHTNTGADSEVRTFVTSDCAYTISPASRSVTWEGETYAVAVTATHTECEWSTSESYDWISLSPTSGSGSDTVQVTVSANEGEARSATITIAGQDHTINQDPAGCSYTISPAGQSVDHDGATYDVTITATHSECEWSTSENYDWISLSPASGSGNGTVRVTVSANTGAARSAAITIAGRPHTVNQAGGACTYTISPTIQSVNFEGDAYTVTVTATHSECDWSTSEDYDWISISPASGSGNGTVRVTVAANPGVARSATITIAGQDHTINQDPAGCSYTIAPTSRSVDNEGETYSVTVTATHSGCDWSASENDDWISISPTSGSGSGTVRVTVAANTGASRSATITIAGRPHTVSQAAGSCTYAIAPTSRSVDNEGEAYTVTVTATHSGCDWSTSENYTWISLSPTSGSGSGTVRVTVSANTGAARSATISIAGRPHAVNQEAGSCTYTIAPTSQSVDNEGETYSVTVTATHGGCDWSTSENYTWISLSPTSGNGSGTVRVTVSANTGAARSATISIAGRPHTVSQEAGSCTYAISPTSRSVDNEGETYSVTVTATHSGCDWSTSENYTWISLSPTSGSGSGTVRVTVSANTGAARSATISIAGRPHTVSQEAGACTYAIAPTSRTVDDSGEAYDVTVTATHSECDWNASENYTWISLSPTSGSGNGTVRVAVSANYGVARSATIAIAGRPHTVNQSPGDITAPTPNPLTWSAEPYETSTSSISMRATTASDPTGPVMYYFDFYSSPTSGSGGNDSGWQNSTSYSDSGLGANHRYGYRVRARDGNNNQTGYSSVSYDYTDIETPAGISFGTIDSTSIQARSSNTPSNLSSGSSGLYIQNYSNENNSGWKQNNDYWTSAKLTPNTNYGFRAIARNGDGNNTPWSGISYRRTLAVTPGVIYTSSRTANSIRVYWTSNGNPSGTEYQCLRYPGSVYSSWTTSLNLLWTGLDCGTTYQFWVRARNADNTTTGWTAAYSQSTLSCPSITSARFDPASPRSILIGYDVTITIGYNNTLSEDVLIFARPYTNGLLTPNYSASGGDRCSPGSGTAEQYFTITVPRTQVDQVRIWITNVGQTQTFSTYSYNVDYWFDTIY
ncbi:hypothetical protein Dvar_55170 [Desulfosarcina variabilis str. Montpellier]